MTILLVSPNWLGDAVMALPAAAAIRRAATTKRVVVAARPAVAQLWELIAGVDHVVPLPKGTGTHRWTAVRRGAASIRAVGADAAVLLPNSFQSALTVRLAAMHATIRYLRPTNLAHPTRNRRGRPHRTMPGNRRSG